MKKVHPRGFKAFIKTHLVSIIVVAIAILSVGAFLFWQNSAASAKIAKTNADTQKMIKETDQK